MSLLSLALLAVGCAPPQDPTFGTGGEALPDAWLDGWYQDRFSETWEICGRPDEFRPWDPMPVQYEERGPYQRLVEWDCIYRILDDLELDYEAEYAANPDLSDSYIYKLAFSAYAVLSLDFGTIEDLQARVATGQDPWLTPPFVEEIATLGRLAGETDVRPVLYNMVTSSMVETVWDRDIPNGTVAWVDIDLRVLHMQPPNAEEYLAHAAYLVHEATHLWRQQPHVACVAGCLGGSDRKCDETFDGPYGSAASVASLMLDQLPWEEDPAWAEQQQDGLFGAVNGAWGHIIEVCYNEDYEM